LAAAPAIEKLPPKHAEIDITHQTSMGTPYFAVIPSITGIINVTAGTAPIKPLMSADNQ